MTTSLLDIPLTRLDGAASTLRDYAGKALLIVNVASKCGLTPQYEGLESLYKEYGARGLEVLGFPANDFGEQEPGSDAEIHEFCTSIYGVQFPMYSKIVVTGADKHPLYRALIDAQPVTAFKPGSKILEYQLRLDPNAASSTEVHWNFEKFLVDKDGAVVQRFGPDTEPRDPAIIHAIEGALGSKQAPPAH